MTRQLIVLIADDSATSRAVMEKQLRTLGCQVSSASSGFSALAAMEQYAYDLVLLDCCMPDMHGCEVAKRVREDEKKAAGRYTPIIAVSAEVGAAHRQRCLDSGMNGVLSKPLPDAELKQLLSFWCDLTLMPIGPVATSSRTDLLKLFLRTSLDDLTAMQAALDYLDLQATSRLAHRMKGAALTVGADLIVATLERIEAIARLSINEAVPALPAQFASLQVQLKTIETN